MPTTHRYVVPSDLWKSLLASPTAMEAIQAKALTYDGRDSPALVCADADADAAADAAYAASQREALTQIVLEELALTAVQDWRPSESMPEDYYALRIA